VNESLLPARPDSLVDVLDRLLETGVAVSGDLVLSVADVDLVVVGLRAVLAAVDALERGSEGPRRSTSSASPRTDEPARVPEAQPASTLEATTANVGSSAASAPRADPVLRPWTSEDDERVDRGLAGLVIAVADLLRELMERQAIRRMEAGTLSEEEVERLGRALARLAERMAELKGRFGLDDRPNRPLLSVRDLAREG
jgi:hypothetical protein